MSSGEASGWDSGSATGTQMAAPARVVKSNAFWRNEHLARHVDIALSARHIRHFVPSEMDKI